MLVPADFPLESLKNDAERTVVNAFCDRLPDSWFVLPSVALTGQRDREIDVVLIHARDGIVAVETKGHRPKVIEGLWYSEGSLMQPQPVEQARSNAYALRGLIRGLDPSLAHVEVEFAVALPNLDDIGVRLPPDLDRSQILTHADLEDCLGAIEAVLYHRHRNRLLGEAGVKTVISALRPTFEFVVDPDERAARVRQRLDVISAERVQALESLDLNRRVCVTGAAGTGKSRLALAWARRAVLRGERVLLTCFNVPLADWLRSNLDPSETLVVGAFHDVALHLDGMPSLTVPDDADRAWWDTVEVGHLDAHWHEVTQRFDTIIVDEAQDFRQTWINQLERLLDDDGPRRMMLVADAAQTIYPRGFRLPRADDGWTRCELTANCRNTFGIATLLHRQFGGAIPPVAGPESEDIDWFSADSPDELSGAVGDALDALEQREHGAETILVATLTGAVRDRLREDFDFVRWEDRDPQAILCENVQRIKGLQYDHVLLVIHDASTADDLLYVGISRAVMSLTVIGPTAVGERLGIADGERLTTRAEQ